MKNKNNDKSASELLNLITEVREARIGGKYDQFAHSYAVGIFISIMDNARNGYTNLQENINISYEAHSKELQEVKDREMKSLQSACNQAAREELDLYA